MKPVWVLLVCGVIAGCNRNAGTASAEAPPPPREPVVVAPGTVEPVSEEIRIAPEMAGRLAAVPVEEGSPVRRGQVLAALEDREYLARVSLAEAQLAVREAELERVNNAARAEERREALAAAKAAAALLENARTAMLRQRNLFRTGDVAKAEVDRTEAEFRAAEARHQEALDHHALVDAQARTEDRSKAGAAVALARAQIEEARALLSKTVMHAPISGVVLRKHRKAGETVSEAEPVLTIADVSVLRVRIDLDENDVAKVALGQRAYCQAAAYGDRKFTGRVVRIGQILGKKRVRTGEPAEHQDTRILETLVELDKDQRLPPGLRVDVFLQVPAR